LFDLLLRINYAAAVSVVKCRAV